MPSVLAIPVTDLGAQRYHCHICANVTRFDVELTARIKYYHHQGIGVGMNPEDVEVMVVLEHSVVCVGCGNKHPDVVGEIIWEETGVAQTAP
jgi:hypothetical protein